MRRAPHASATPSTNLTGEFGLLHAVDDRLAAYGYETNTGVRFVVVVDVRAGESRAGLRDADLRPVRCPLPPLSPHTTRASLLLPGVGAPSSTSRTSH